MNPKESTVQKTILVPPHPHELLANAVLHLAKALDDPCGIAGVGPSCEAARDLVRDLAAPEHAENPSTAPRDPFIHVRETRTRPDGTMEVRERLSSGQASTPTMAELKGRLSALRADIPLWTLEWKGDRFRVTDGIVTATTDVIAPDATVKARVEAINALVRGMRLTMAELERITAARVDRNGKVTPIYDDERVMVRAVSPAYPGPDVEQDTWALDPDATGHRAPFSPGDLVVRSSGRAGIHRIVDLTVDGDAPRHRSLRLKVEPTDVCVDADAF